MKVKLASIVGDLEVEEIEFGDGEIITDVFVIVRTVKPDRDHPTTAFTSTDALADSAMGLGVMDMVADKLRHDALRGWSDEE